jgi:cell division protease FtsH
MAAGAGQDLATNQYDNKAAPGTIALANEGRAIPTFHPGLLERPFIDEISLSDGLGLARAHQVTDVMITETTPPEAYVRTASGKSYRFTLASIADAREIAGQGVRMSVTSGRNLLTETMDVGKAVLEFAVASAIIAFAIVQTRGKIRVPSRRMRPESTSVRFSDIAGQDPAKESLLEVLALLRNPDKLTRIGARIPRGIVLKGPPGTGKTLLAKAVATEAGVPFFSLRGSELLDKYINTGAKRIQEAFRVARRRAPCVLFIDEIDVVAAARNSTGNGTDAQDERDRMLTQMLTEIDGMEELGLVVVIGATNRFQVLDPAILRPGRLERHINVPLPTREGRRKQIQLEAMRLRIGSGVDLARVERLTIGFSGADISGLLNEAALGAHRDGRDTLTMDDIVGARDHMLMGHVIRGAIMSDEERLQTAWHEAGHVIVTMHSPKADKIEKATILPRGGSLGHVQRLPERDSQTMSRDRILEELAIALAGRAGEMARYPQGEISVGASGDILDATLIARRYVEQDGLDEQIGMISLRPDKSQGHDVWPPPALKDLAGIRVKQLLSDALSKASAILDENKGEHAAVTKRLLEIETVSGDELETLVADLKAGRIRAPTEGDIQRTLRETSPHTGPGAIVTRMPIAATN